jgi:hypothetical protein
VPNILYRVGIKGSLKKVYEAIATPEGLSHWWITETKGDSKTGGHIYRHDSDIRNATGWHGVTAAAMEDCGAGSATSQCPTKWSTVPWMLRWVKGGIYEAG